MKPMTACLLYVGLLIPSFVLSQPGALIPGELIDLPSVMALPRGGIQASLRLYPEGGVLGEVDIGVTPDLMMGVSYGGTNLIGMGKPNMNPLPCVHLSYRLFEERMFFPAFVVGFHSQGFGGYDKALKRYAIKSRGFYGVASKNTAFLGGLGLHLGMNYSLEQEDQDRDINGFVGFHKWITPSLSCLLEYDAAINDNTDDALGSGKGYLNVGLRWAAAPRFFVEVAWKNLLKNRENLPRGSREIKLLYLGSLVE